MLDNQKRLFYNKAKLNKKGERLCKTKNKRLKS